MRFSVFLRREPRPFAEQPGKMLLAGNSHIHGDFQQAPAGAGQEQLRLLDADALQVFIHGFVRMLPEKPVQIGGLNMKLMGDDGGCKGLGIVPAHDGQRLGHIAVGAGWLRLVLFQKAGYLQHHLDAQQGTEEE